MALILRAFLRRSKSLYPYQLTVKFWLSRLINRARQLRDGGKMVLMEQLFPLRTQIFFGSLVKGTLVFSWHKREIKHLRILLAELGKLAHQFRRMGLDLVVLIQMVLGFSRWRME